MYIEKNIYACWSKNKKIIYNFSSTIMSKEISDSIGLQQEKFLNLSLMKEYYFYIIKANIN